MTDIGFDLAGPENILVPLIYYAEGLLRFRERQKEAGVDIPLILHAGETCGDGTEADMNLYDAILLGSQRIGHGYPDFRKRLLPWFINPFQVFTCKTSQTHGDMQRKGNFDRSVPYIV